VENNEIKEIYSEDTQGRRYHPSIITKQKERTTDEPSECTTLKLNEPMLWKDFKTLTTDLKIMYIEHLLTTYSPTQKDVYLMLDCSPAHFHRTLAKLGLIGIFPGPGNKQTKAQKRAWNAFIRNRPNPDVTPKLIPNTTPTPTPSTKLIKHAEIKEFSFIQTGPFNMAELTKRLSAFINDGDNYTVTIYVTNKETHHES
jgi:hypothetical protein